MNIGRAILRLLSPHEESQRDQIREQMEQANCHADDVLRTISIDGDLLRRKIAEALSDRTLPQ